MPRLFLIGLVCLSVVLMRISGVHLHACAGLESAEEHPPVHLADNGLFFGEHHALDDEDDIERDLPDLRPVKFDYSPEASPVLVYTSSVPLTSTTLVQSPPARGPPQQWRPAPFELSPPSRGPPALS